VRVASATDEVELEDGVELLAGAADEVVLLELEFELLLPHAAAIKASGTSNRAGNLRAGNLTRASFFGLVPGVSTERTRPCIETAF
jgi:hypothetical protein